MKKLFIFTIFFVMNFYGYASIHQENKKRAFFEMYSDFSNIPADISYSGLMGGDNPASLFFIKTNGSYTKFFWSDKDKRSENYNNWAIFSANPGIGIGLVKETEFSKSIYNGRVGIARGEENCSIGVGYGFGIGDGYFFRNNQDYWIFGILYNYEKIISFGGTYLIENYSDYKEEQYYCLLKPLKNDNFVLGYEHAYQSSGYITTLQESYSAYFKFLKRIALSGRFYNNGKYNLGINISIIDEFEVMYNAFFNRSNVYQNGVYGIGGVYKNNGDENDWFRKNENF